MTTIESIPADPGGAAMLKAVAELSQHRPVTAARAIFNERGVKLLEQGSRLDGSLYERLVSHKLIEPLEDCVETPDGVSVEGIREAAEAVMATSPFFAGIGAVSRQRALVLEAISAIPLPAPIAVQLTIARDTRTELYEHSILMTLLCAHLMRESGGVGHDITMAASAGLLHDLGMLHIDPASLQSDNRLEGDQRKLLYAHSLTSSMLLARFHQYSREVARAVLEHHERMDGSGYPRSLAGEAISPMGRILSLAEVVTAMFGGQRPFPEQRVSLLLRLSPRRYDPALVPSIHKLLRALPAADLEPPMPLADSLRRLREHAGLLERWDASVAAPGTADDPALGVVLNSLQPQVHSLQRMLSDAGIEVMQLDALGQLALGDRVVALELWALGEELQWQLSTLAFQIQRRVKAGSLPAAWDDWIARARVLGSS